MAWFEFISSLSWKLQKPVNVINSDIINVFGNLNLSNIIGDPSNFYGSQSGYSYGYPIESVCAKQVFSRYAGTKIALNDYITAVENLSPIITGIIKGIEQLVPARSQVINHGILIENHLLESSRFQQNDPSILPLVISSDSLEKPLLFTSDIPMTSGTLTPIVESWSGNVNGTTINTLLSSKQLKYVQNTPTVTKYRMVGNNTVYPFRSTVSNPKNTSVLTQFNRNFLITDSTVSDWQSSISGIIQISRKDTGKKTYSNENTIRLEIPVSTSGNPVSATEHYFNIYVNGQLLDDSKTTFDFAIPNINGLPFLIQRKAKFLDQRIGIVQLKVTNLLSGISNQLPIIISVDEAQFGGSIEMKTQLST